MPAISYLIERGISAEIIAEMGAMPIEHPAPEDVEKAYKTYLHETRCKDGEPRKVVRGVLFPYALADAEKFGRVRILQPAETWVAALTEKGEAVPRFLSPAKFALNGSAAHLYILPIDQAKAGKSKDIFLFVEGEAKTAKVSQHARLLDDDNDNHVVIGGGGVSMFLCTPEMRTLNFKSRRVLICFDSDSFGKLEVMQQEIQLAAYCLAHGARSVKSLWWQPKKGKGIDDYLTQQADPTAALAKLKTRALSPFLKYAKPPLKGVEGYALNALCHEIAKQSLLKGFHLSMIVKDLETGFKPRGISRKDIRQELAKAIASRRKQETPAANNGSHYQELLGLEYEPNFPEVFVPQDEWLLYEGKLGRQTLCRLFVIAKYVATEDQGERDTYLLKFVNKSLLVPSDNQANYKQLAMLFNQNREILYDEIAKKVQMYIAQFWQCNSTKIPVVPFYKNTGWNGSFFRLPAITQTINQAEYDP